MWLVVETEKERDHCSLREFFSLSTTKVLEGHNLVEKCKVCIFQLEPTIFEGAKSAGVVKFTLGCTELDIC